MSIAIQHPTRSQPSEHRNVPVLPILLAVVVAALVALVAIQWSGVFSTDGQPSAPARQVDPSQGPNVGLAPDLASRQVADPKVRVGHRHRRPKRRVRAQHHVSGRLIGPGRDRFLQSARGDRVATQSLPHSMVATRTLGCRVKRPWQTRAATVSPIGEGERHMRSGS